MVTIKDVARAAGVSNMTVSRAFMTDSSMKKETRERVLAVAKKLNYIPNYSAKSLVMNRQFSIGLFFSSMTGTAESFLGELINQVYSLLPKNYILSVNSVDKIEATKNTILGRFDGIIVISQSEKDDPFIEQVNKMNIPFVIMNRPIKDSSIYNVSSNESIGIRQVVEAVAKGDIQTAGCIKGIFGFYSSDYRYNEFVQSCHACGIRFIEEAVESGEYSIDSGYSAMERLIQRCSHLPDVIFCENDDMAIGAIKSCKEHGISIPEDLSIIGFDDTNFSKYTIPSLTTIHKPYREMAIQAMQILLQLIDGKQPVEKIYYIESRMVIRDSVKK